MDAGLTPEDLESIERDAARFRTGATPALKLLSAYFDPVLHGLEHVPQSGPVLFVGNHTVTGAFDTAVMIWELWRRRSIQIFALGDHMHFRVPVWRDLMRANATVPGTRQNCGALLDSGRHVLVFPGGGREVCKRRDEKYKLIWKERMGFAAMAIEHGATIIPFAAVGGEEVFDIVVDSSDVLGSPLRPVYERLQAALGLPLDEMMPVVRGWGPLPRPVRLYFEFASPIAPASADGAGPEGAVRELRERTRTAVEASLQRLLSERDRDPSRDLRTRMRSRLGGLRR